MKRSYLLMGSILLIIVAGFIMAGYFINKQNEVVILPVYGEKDEQGNEHLIHDFRFVDQNGDTVTQDNFRNKIYIADFFFTTCQGICPIMSNQMERVQKEISSLNDVYILSHTVKPEEDSVPVLKAYANRHHAIDGKWYFLTGNKKELYDMARYAYLVSVTGGTGDSSDFVHTQMFTLIDRNRRIRGYYDGTDSLEVTRLMADIHSLVRE